MFYKAQRYDIRGREYLKTQNKYYACDLGLRNAQINFRQMEMTHAIENLVYLELLRRDYTLKDTAAGDSISEYWDNFAQIRGELTLDLGGFTLSQSANNTKNQSIFQASSKQWSTTSDGRGYVFPTTVNVKNGKLEIGNKGKRRQVYLPRKLRKELLSYCADNGISQGPVFLTFGGQVPDRVNIWYMLKRLARRAGVEEQKVYPHNFRHLFARSYYDINRDIAHLADLLGHSNVETTRRYTLETVQAEEETLERMGLI